MSEADTPTDDAEVPTDEQPELSFEEGRQQTSSYSESTKTYVAELPEGGVWTFEYKMVDRKKIVERNTTIKNTRSGQEQDTDFEAVELEMFCEGVVDAPSGFPMSPTKLKRQDQTLKDIVAEVADLISEFSTADDETIRKFL